ncbi:MAG: peptidylprolyl isomerase [Firmicutes bacterium]|nr:peptidylprolyl isomerase [Bacillota bacterium]
MANPIIKIHIEGAGPMTFELYPEKAPITVKHFLTLAEEGFYSGLIFHKLIKEFMAQTGGHEMDFVERERPETIYGEFAENGWDKNDIKHERGVLTMARPLTKPDGATTQFCIMLGDWPTLDGKYAAFGRMIDGMDLLDIIEDQPTGKFGPDRDVPLTWIIIERVEICNPEEFSL